MPIAPPRRRPRAARVAVSAALVVGLGAASACSNAATDPEAPFTPSAFDKGSQVSVLLASGSALGKPIEEALTKAEFTADVQVGIDGQDQHERLARIIEAKPKVLIVDTMNADAIRADLDKVQETGAAVVALSSLPKDTKAIDFFVGIDPRAEGKLQGQALVDGVRGRVEKAPSAVELFAGSAADAAAQMRFDAAMEVVRPAIDAQTIVVRSGEREFAQAAMPDAKAAGARMGTLLGSYYPKTAPQGFLAPNDTVAQTVMGEVRATGLPVTPFSTGAGSTIFGTKALMTGQLGMTTYLDPATLANTVATLVRELSEGKEPTLNHKDGFGNGTEDIPAQLLEPVAVTRANAATVFAGNAALKELVTPSK